MARPFQEYYTLTLSLNFDLHVKWYMSALQLVQNVSVISDKDYIMAIIVLSTLIIWPFYEFSVFIPGMWHMTGSDLFPFLLMISDSKSGITKYYELHILAFFWQGSCDLANLSIVIFVTGTILMFTYETVTNSSEWTNTLLLQQHRKKQLNLPECRMSRAWRSILRLDLQDNA